MPLSKWCQLTRDANVGRNVEKEHPTSITVRGGGPGSCPLSVSENCPGRRRELLHIVGLGLSSAADKFHNTSTSIVTRVTTPKAIS